MANRKLIWLLIAALAVLGFLRLLYQPAAERAGPAASGTRVVADMAGNRVVLPAEVTRITTNGVSLSSLLLLLGAAPKLVATSPVVQDNPWFAKVFPGIRNIPAVFAGTLHLEELLKVKPEVVILWSNNDLLKKQLESVRIPVFIVYFSTPAEFKQAVTLLGQVLGPREADKAARFCRYFDGIVGQLTARQAAADPNRKPGVYYIADHLLNTEGKNSVVTSWIAMAGGVNVAAAGGVESVRADISMESLVNWQPDVIITRDADQRALVFQDSRCQQLPAVLNGEVYVSPKGVNAWCTRSGESALQLLWAAKILQPDRFRDIDMNQAVREFYKIFYDYELNETEVQAILHPPT
ncbi:MAG TPA: ABC transporter substrate-binding protein [Methylomusa anaerophila]|uniref:Corrinoid ABC transporter substrate-binding protein n=1 Tax=Methylomusa anaerophila TaxID=1930071 RepID=A0A348AFF2_9FIRM|nr:ABC transporter substrate-binding protein [Methylomusa anaerophila]BBB89800.1 corrinoid ABC transporter substrate-binding protein [Methylomusa anaerophila]HML89153.1 ABC transporter substrate-binding protein [Methylomusa anaerophila]